MSDENDDLPDERPRDGKTRAADKAAELRIHAQLGAVFEAVRKFDAELRPLNGEIAREVQRRMGKLEKAKHGETPLLEPTAWGESTELLLLADTRELSSNDYHILRRPGELMIVRWLAGEQVDTFYQRLQAHFDAALAGAREDERSALEWKQDPATLSYLDALDALEFKTDEWYLREPMRKHGLHVLSTQTADELNIAYLADYVMGVSPDELVGPASALPEDAAESDLAWFFKLFALRAVVEKTERMCFFAYLQKSDGEQW